MQDNQVSLWLALRKCNLKSWGKIQTRLQLHLTWNTVCGWTPLGRNIILLYWYYIEQLWQAIKNLNDLLICKPCLFILPIHFLVVCQKLFALRINANIKYNHLNWESLRNGMSMMTKFFGLWDKSVPIVERYAHLHFPLHLTYHFGRIDEDQHRLKCIKGFLKHSNLGSLPVHYSQNIDTFPSVTSSDLNYL